MTRGRLEYLKRLFRYLQNNQNEDCLYLNIYTPETLAGRFHIETKYDADVLETHKKIYDLKNTTHVPEQKGQVHKDPSKGKGGTW